MRTFLEIMNFDLPHVEKMRIGSLCVNDPVSVAIHFKKRVEGFISAVLKNKEGPLGEVGHYFMRVEYQMRGAPHVHMKVWCQDNIDGIPVVGESTKERIQAFVEKYITCGIPSRTENPKLRELVLAFQCHTCGKGCKRNFVVKGNKVLTKCRHGFPRAPSTNFQVSSFKESMESRKSAHRRNEKLYTLVRSYEERFVNDYNPTLLMLWQANMDIQLISENSFCLNSYITSYVTKKEKSAADDLWAAVKDSNPSLYAQLHKFARMMLKNREIGAYEAVDKLLGHPLFYSSDAVMYLSVMPHDKRKRRIKPFKELEQLRADSANVFFDNLLDTYYPKRSLELEDVSLFVIATEYEFERAKEDAKKQAQQTRRAADDKGGFYALLDGSGFFRKRKSHPKILKTPRFSLKTDIGLENHFHALLMLFKPWRKEDELLGDKTSFSKAYLVCCDKFPAMEEFHRRKMQTETARELARSIVLEAERKAEEEQSDVDAANELAFEETEKIQDKFADAPYMAPSEDEYDKVVNNLNKNQRKIFDRIDSVVNAQMVDEKSEPPIKMIISGVAGTGKSFLIEVLIAAIRRHFPTASVSDPSPVAVLAPTGIAAFNIRSWTILGYFKLNVQHGKDGALFNLSPDDQKMFRAKWSPVKLIIIDEFSMVSNSTLAKIHTRLSNVLDGDDFNCAFAGKNIVMFGDLLQLPPVNAQFCFEDLSSKLCGEILGSIGGYNLRRDFTYSELQENMRQQDDLAYAQMLNRIRIGSPTEEDIEQLKARLVEVPALYACKKLAYIAEKFDKENDDARNSICLLPINVQVDEFNQTMLELKKITIEEIYADDKQKNMAKKSKKLANPVPKLTLKKKKTSDTGSLEECLKIGVGVRVMLRRNLNVAAGLVNGSLGTVKEIKKINGQVEIVDVEFDANKNRVKIEKVTAEFEISPRVYVTRKQFPLCLAYAITIHKSQGLTLDHVLIDLGTSCFEDAMAYVALSRARCLSKVHLLDFEPTVINCKRIAVEEYDRLRQSIGLPKLPPYNQRLEKYKKLASRNVMAKREIVVSAITSKRPMRKRNMKNDPGQSDSTAAKRQCSSSVQEPQSVPSNVRWLPFENKDSVSCYANSIVQAILQLKDLPDCLGSGNDVSKMLRSVFTACVTVDSHLCPLTTFNLRSFVADAPDTSSQEDFHAHQQQDASEFFQALLQALPSATSNWFQFNQVKTRQCSNPNCLLLPTFTDLPPSHVLHAFLKEEEVCSKGNEPKFVDVVPRSMTDNLPSTKCELCGQPKMDVTETRSAPTQKYLVVRLELFQTSKRFVAGSQRMSDRKIKSFNANRMNILGKNFRTVAAIKHSGETPVSGHYSTWIRSGVTNWVEVSDDRCSLPRQKFVDNLKDISVLLFEKL